MSQYDRLSLVMNHTEAVSLIGYYPARDNDSADLENGFPCAGRWKMDYVDSFPAGTDLEYATSIADAMWGTVFTDTGDIYAGDILTWNEYRNGDDHVVWSLRDKTVYESKCAEYWLQDSSTTHDNE